ncbi:MAG: APC family permease, partial [Gammaproteobacteria bacterium]|nr:APC family permease [Gammaproteobacteria bacterium]
MSNVSLNNKAFIGFFTLAMINVAAIVNLSNTPTMSVIGPGFISYFVLACVFFFLPTAFVAAELSTAWPLRGGLYDWVKLAFGPEIGFLAVWLQWIANVIWYPTLFAPAIAGVTYLFSPALADNKWYMFSVMVGFFWMLTLVNLQGMRESSLISSVGVILGSILPGAIVVIFSVIWLFKGLPVGVAFHLHEFVPPLNNLNSMSILLGLLVTFAGMEMSVVHAGNVKNPRITYPRAIFLASIIIMAVFVFVSLALTIIIPPAKIDIVSGLMQTIKQFCETMRIDWLLPILGILVGVGSMTMASTWVAGPSRGFHIASFDTGLLRFLQKTNKHDMPNRIMLLQAILFTMLTSLFLFMPTITNSYWI